MPNQKEEFLPLIDNLQKIAGKYSRRKAESEDLVQDLFLETVRTKRNITDENYLAWANGFLRNRAAFIARTEGRRRKREESVQNLYEAENYKRLQFPEKFLDQLSPALQKTARLLNCGLTKKEIRYLLEVSDVSLRQRFTVLRKKWKKYVESDPDSGENLEKFDTPLNIGLLRRALQKSLKERGESAKVIGSFDPDGNLFVFRSVSAHKKGISGNYKHEEEL